MAIIAPEEHMLGYYSFSLFCLSIVVACYAKGRLLDFAVSCIASVVVGIGVFYLFTEIKKGVFFSGSESKPSIFNAILFCIVLGYPAAQIVYKARFGLSKRNKLEESFTETSNHDKLNN